MSQDRELREFQLVELMLNDRQQLYVEFLRVMQVKSEGGRGTDRDIIQAILDREFR